MSDSGEIEAVIGQQVILTCKFFASPNVNITWESNVLNGIAHHISPADADGQGKLIMDGWASFILFLGKKYIDGFSIHFKLLFII